MSRNSSLNLNKSCYAVKYLNAFFPKISKLILTRVVFCLALNAK